MKVRMPKQPGAVQGRLPAITIEAGDLPEDVLGLLDRHFLDLGGSYRDPNVGDPIQDDELCIEHDEGDVERRIHQVCCLDDHGALER